MKDKIIDGLSLANLSLGFISIILAFQGFFLYSAYLVIAAALIEFSHLSGRKVLKAGSVFSKDLSIIAETVSFVLAPAIFSYVFFAQQLGDMSYVFLVFSAALVLSGAVRSALLSSGQMTGWSGMKSTFNVIIPVLYVLNLFSLYIISGWMVLSSVFMLSRFRISLRKKKKSEKAVELKEDYADVKEPKEEEEKESPLVPLSIFGD